MTHLHRAAADGFAADAERAKVERDVRAPIAATPDLAGRERGTYPYETIACARRKLN